MNDVALEEVHNYKHLGIWITSTCSIWAGQSFIVKLSIETNEQMQNNSSNIYTERPAASDLKKNRWSQVAYMSMHNELHKQLHDRHAISIVYSHCVSSLHYPLLVQASNQSVSQG